MPPEEDYLTYGQIKELERLLRRVRDAQECISAFEERLENAQKALQTGQEFLARTLEERDEFVASL